MQFMADGHTDLASLRFLGNTSRVRDWVESISRTQLKASTVSHYLTNISQFVEYLREAPPPHCRLGSSALTGLSRELRYVRKSVQRKLVLHQLRVKADKDSRGMSASLLMECRDKARLEIPKLLGKLESDGSLKTQWLFYGYVVAYLCSLFGHRGGVYANLLVSEVEMARHDDGVYLINVETHKTNRAFGVAQLPLTEGEYGWFSQFLELREGLTGCTTSQYFFFTQSDKPCRNLNQYMQNAWADMGFSGRPVITDFRTSIATHVSISYGHCGERGWVMVLVMGR